MQRNGHMLLWTTHVPGHLVDCAVYVAERGDYGQEVGRKWAGSRLQEQNMGTCDALGAHTMHLLVHTRAHTHVTPPGPVHGCLPLLCSATHTIQAVQYPIPHPVRPIAADITAWSKVQGTGL